MTISKLWVLRSLWSNEKHDQKLTTTPSAAKPSAPKMSGIKKYIVTEPWLKLSCGLGEAPFWEDVTNTLRFVDIIKCNVHTVDLKKGPSSHKILANLDISIGVTGDIEGNDSEFIFGGKHGYGRFNRSTAEYKYIRKVWDEAEIADGKESRMRANDGAVDSRGRFWVGFMTDPMVKDPVDEGILFRLDPDLTLHRMLSGVTIPNGTTWSADDKTMYFADSPTKSIFAFDFDAETGKISNKRVFFTVPDDMGENAVPDGHCMDEEGYMWTAIHGTGKVVRISPESKVVAEITLPTDQVTCPAFVGEDLIITSAGGDGSDPTSLAGSVFKVHVGVKGLKRYRFKENGEIV
ncbi:SGL-domain-containing protein [Lepidopterella palustris CBS 459.81]|uniref:SGL-domain-containing protein n=1 Tax=Lepidopterella palustris CBS 459.81 TaxID=1314670 RepID=A0A8E2EL74_9PEZI|nr:SGL-domain-containing protein [Lepidopterella palustris CBS 459.81]